MDNHRTSKPSGQQQFSKSGNCIIQLDHQQYYSYQSEQIDILAPDGTHLESIGHHIKTHEIQNSAARMKEQIFLVECLLGNVIQELKLPAQAVAALMDSLHQMQSVCERYIK